MFLVQEKTFTVSSMLLKNIFKFRFLVSGNIVEEREEITQKPKDTGNDLKFYLLGKI